MNVIETFHQSLEPFGVPIVIYRVGSHAYGLNTPDSDEDFRGIFIGDAEYQLGLQKVEQVRIKEDDWVCHEIKQFIHILIKQNPTIMELLFIESPVYTTLFWDNLKPLLKGLISKESFKPYSAYVLSQLTKAKFRNPSEKRLELIQQFGFDTKYMSHVARLAIQCIYLMRDGHIPVKVPEQFRNDVMNIKMGKVTKEEALAYCEDLDKKMYEAYKVSTLPEKADIKNFENNIYIPLMKQIVDDTYNEWVPKRL